MTTIAVANQKGGVGKTTLAWHLTACLYSYGYSVLAVDADPQANLTSLLTDAEPQDCALLQMVVVGVDPARVVVDLCGDGRCVLVPANSDIGKLYKYLAAAGEPVSTIRNALAELVALFDFTIIDMAPSRSGGFEEVLYAADWFLAPVVLERLALEGLLSMADAVDELEAQAGRAPRLLGVVPNMVRMGTAEHRQQLNVLSRMFGGRVWPPIPQSIRVGEAMSRGQTLFKYEPRHKVTREIGEVCDRVVANVGMGNGQA
jgi:chromosome partitioning protein